MCAPTRALTLAAFFILALAACGKSAPVTPTASDEVRQACVADADCVVVQLTCCDACNGGIVVGVNTAYADEVTRQYITPAVCAETACTEMACSAITANCRGGRCGLAQDGEEWQPPIR